MNNGIQAQRCENLFTQNAIYALLWKQISTQRTIGMAEPSHEKKRKKLSQANENQNKWTQNVKERNWPKMENYENLILNVIGEDDFVSQSGGRDKQIYMYIYFTERNWNWNENSQNSLLEFGILSSLKCNALVEQFAHSFASIVAQSASIESGYVMNIWSWSVQKVAATKQQF